LGQWRKGAGGKKGVASQSKGDNDEWAEEEDFDDWVRGGGGGGGGKGGGGKGLGGGGGGKGKGLELGKGKEPAPAEEPIKKLLV